MRDEDRGKINNEEMAKQLNCFCGLRYDTITPTDIDGFVEFADRLFILLEGKRVGASLSGGQRLAFERLCDAVQSTGRIFSVAVYEHDIPPPQQIDVASCSVVEYRWLGKWNTIKSGVTVRQFIDKIRREYLC